MKPVTPEQLKEIVDLANSVPDEFKQKCFELLLAHSLAGRTIKEEPIQKPPAPVPATSPKPPVLPIDVRAFFSQYNIDQSKLAKLFFIEGSEIRPLYHIKTTVKANAQVQLALLMTLEQALNDGQFSVQIESLRTRCDELKMYDSVNFMTILKKNSSLFKAVDKSQPLVLSSDGKSELADLIEELTA